MEINVTKTVLPPFEKYVGYLRRIWDSNQLTNNGALVRELEARLREHLGGTGVCFVANGTLALQLALNGLRVAGEVLTTPFSYVATTGAILWQNCTPKFVDIRPDDLTIDPDLLEPALTPRTTAILATHVYGHPCDVDRLGRFAREHGLKLIFDAAHAFGCELGGRPLSTYGDISCLSFHATKIFHTVEGGALVVNGDETLVARVRLMRAFGHIADEHHCLGINAKNSEFHAAMGLCNLAQVDAAIAHRRRQYERYRALLSGTALQLPSPRPVFPFKPNYAYCPAVLPSEEAVHRVLAALGRLGIRPRRYFYPALNLLPYLSGERCPIAEDVSRRVLCLPMSGDVSAATQRAIAAVLQEAAVLHESAA